MSEGYDALSAFRIKMAFLVKNFSKYSGIIIFTRSLKYCTGSKKCLHFSTSQINPENSEPVKFTKHKAAKISISETIGLKVSEEKSSNLWYEKYVLFTCIFINFLYFGVLRQENDIDEILKGNSDYNESKTKLMKLKIYLKYCENNKLSTAELKAKIQELEEEEMKGKLVSRI